jgi:hypothetical protein
MHVAGWKPSRRQLAAVSAILMMVEAQKVSDKAHPVVVGSRPTRMAQRRVPLLIVLRLESRPPGSARGELSSRVRDAQLVGDESCVFSKSDHLDVHVSRAEGVRASPRCLYAGYTQVRPSFAG